MNTRNVLRVIGKALLTVIVSLAVVYFLAIVFITSVEISKHMQEKDRQTEEKETVVLVPPEVDEKLLGIGHQGSNSEVSVTVEATQVATALPTVKPTIAVPQSTPMPTPLPDTKEQEAVRLMKRAANDVLTGYSTMPREAIWIMLYLEALPGGQEAHIYYDGRFSILESELDSIFHWKTDTFGMVYSLPDTLTKGELQVKYPENTVSEGYLCFRTFDSIIGPDGEEYPFLDNTGAIEKFGEGNYEWRELEDYYNIVKLGIHSREWPESYDPACLTDYSEHLLDNFRID